MVIDHVGLNVSDLEKMKSFLTQALAPLGMTILKEADGWAMIGKKGEGEFWFGTFGEPPGPVHIAFSASTRAQVREFHRAALAAGGKDNGAPGLRPQYHANYYGAFVIGPDGHNIEAVCHKPE